jgi:3-oxoacyl-[acyl-carrier protein] reductase
MEKNIVKKIFILGASSDIGVLTTKKFLDNNYFVYAHYNKNSFNLLKIKNCNLKLIKFNLKNIKSFENFLNKNKYLTEVDCFVSLTGYMKLSKFINFKIKDFYDHININYLSNIIFLKKSIKYMNQNNFGRILLCSSIGTKFGGGLNNYLYSISKFMNEFFPKSIREMNKKNIFLNTLQIGLTDTKLIYKDKSKDLNQRIKLIPIKRIAEVEEVVNYIYSLCNKKNSLLTNQIVNISGGE